MPALLAERAMLLRTESKFIVPMDTLDDLLRRLGDDYAVLTAGSAVVATYRSLYFDTASRSMFHAHRRGRRVRQKVRIRHYPDRRVSVLEVKMRRNDRQTIKIRRPRRFDDNTLTEADLAFIRAHVPLDERLRAQAWVGYRRLTLLGLHTPERVTIDVDLDLIGGVQPAHLRGAAIVEVKQARLASDSVAMSALRGVHAFAGSISKYCLAVIMTHPGIRTGRLQSDVRALSRVGQWVS